MERIKSVLSYSQCTTATREALTRIDGGQLHSIFTASGVPARYLNYRLKILDIDSIFSVLDKLLRERVHGYVQQDDKSS